MYSIFWTLLVHSSILHPETTLAIAWSKIRLIALEMYSVANYGQETFCFLAIVFYRWELQLLSSGINEIHEDLMFYDVLCMRSVEVMEKRGFFLSRGKSSSIIQQSHQRHGR